MFITKDKNGNFQIHLNATDIENSFYALENLMVILSPEKAKELEDHLEESLKS